MDEKESFLFYSSWYEIIIEEYEDYKTQNELIRALVHYGVTGEQTFPTERMFLRQAYTQIDSAKNKWEDIRQKRAEAGKKGGLRGKGGAPKGNQNARKTKANNSKQNHNVNVNDNVNDKDNDNVNDNNNNDNDNYNSMPFDSLPLEGQESGQEYTGRLKDGEWV